ncbi:iron-containing alcohol dehydrogenase [Hyphomonas sp. WL0036]|uniref:iron-containing alcohol dehydrogenase n=1 Tax=Hyphomonas sediminis TaxID=2866160 RepID=UPI001C805BC7|nr:iron-containing alcohol dehydrogenase [Hyphomonas sediminis]MBY9066208.1 iron-containing alcohol dehydrogenase [Hyphomonas sediminis]
MPVINFLTQCVFDAGALKQLGSLAKARGITRPFIVTDAGIKASGILAKVEDALGVPAAGVFAETVPNPTETQTKKATALYKESGADGIIAVGGGSSMDHAKAIGLLASHPEPLETYAAIIGGAKKIGKTPPLIAIPTTAGTGSEVSVGMVITMENGRKETFASPNLIPVVALCDPDLTLGLPAGLTAATGMDALTHCIEAVLTPAINPPAEGIGYDGAHRAFGMGMLQRAVKDGSDSEARWHMMMASYEGALAFVKGLGGVHALSHAAGRLHEKKLHHGTLNAVFLPHILRFHNGAADEKYARLRQVMGLKAGADLADAIQDLNDAIGIPKTLSAMGLAASDGPGIVEYALKDLAHFGNPKPMSADDYAKVYEIALG